MDNQKFANLISSARKNKNLTQKELALLLNVSNKSISKWECGKGYPDITMIPIISDVLDIPIDTLFQVKNTEKQTKNIDVILILFLIVLISSLYITKNMDVALYNRIKDSIFNILFIMNIPIILLGYLIYKYNLSSIIAGYDKDKVIDEMGLTKFIGTNIALMGITSNVLMFIFNFYRMNSLLNILVILIVYAIIIIKINIKSKKYEI